MSWETVIGLEVHTELATKSKIFCACTTAFGGSPNTHVCPVCSGMPGTLPRLNRQVVEFAIRTGLALDCDITRYGKFDRKNYVYPDLPKAYQVSQLYAPICQNGHLDIDAGGVPKTIAIREIHMEEDAGKLIHDPLTGSTLVDYNRCGVPLLEIVSQPDFRSAAEVLAYLEKLRETLLFLEVSDCKMQEGSLRADVNLSVRRTGETALGTRTEMKNLNSFRAIGRAIAYEAARQIDVLEEGGVITQETRRWDDDKGVSYSMRSKENAQDYRYFPEPDLLPLRVDDDWVERERAALPELAHQKRARYIADYGLSEKDAATLTGHKRVSDLFEALADKTAAPREAANLVTGELMRLLNRTGTLPEDLSADSGTLARLITLVLDGKINRNAYKEAVEAVFTEDADPDEYISAHGLLMLSDDGAVAEAVAAVVADNPKSVADYRAGKQQALGFLMGQAMRRLGGKGNPAAVSQALKERLN
ncbi:MAG: Asp-tRNA(Asn)/Glu-tRNA(Gln) amidotransferase subunit GatB [Oscillospiraceae bacterium]|jgi:aspartyl-tRNA(Asn)/glutamyl-tRNA(Gln) amidotransferase subunit B|nr:Asp-tRNA(Asn)/Glu-tRNA(Gln) amidotransferase subunit GatB [Oscillospiraceae bacterium]